MRLESLVEPATPSCTGRRSTLTARRSKGWRPYGSRPDETDCGRRAHGLNGGIGHALAEPELLGLSFCRVLDDFSHGCLQHVQHFFRCRVEELLSRVDLVDPLSSESLMQA